METRHMYDDPVLQQKLKFNISKNDIRNIQTLSTEA